jgi:hypothetical protein
MSDLAMLANLAEIAGVLIVIGGVFFAVMQMRQYRQQRREMAAIELFRFFGSPHFTKAYHAVLQLPNGLNKTELRAQFPDAENCAMLISTTMENIGVMVYHRIVPSVVVKNLIGTSTNTLWSKLEHWISDMRNEVGNPGAFEWFQWLSIIMDDIQDRDAAPAYEAHLTWKPARRTREI